MPIYIVDDNSDVCDFLAFLLSSNGHRVHAFAQPDDALSHMKTNNIRPGMLITDYNMPSMNGYELSQEVCRHSPGVKTIVMSGRSLNGEIGGLPFLQKPFTPDHMVSLVEALKPPKP